MLRLVGIVALVSYWCAASAASAQEERAWVVVPTSVGESPTVVELADGVRNALVSSGDAMRSAEALRQAVATRLPQPVAEASEDDLRRLEAADTAVVELLVRGRRNTQAITDAEFALNAVFPRRFALLRTDRGARAIRQLCLHQVRALLAEHRNAEAETKAMDCLRWVPDAQPDNREQPADVRHVVSAQRDRMRTGGGELVVRAGAEDPAGCAIYANGRRIGDTPEARYPIPGGGEYGISVRCEDSEPFRVLVVSTAARGETVVPVYVTLQQALRTEPAVRLVYTSEGQRTRQNPRHALRLASLVAATDALIVRLDEQGEVHLDRSTGEPIQVATAPVASQHSVPTEDEIIQAVRNVTTSQPARTTSSLPSGPDTEEAEGTGGSIVGPLILGIAGAALLGIAVHGVAAGEECVMPGTTSSDCAQWERPNWLGIGLWGGLGVAALGSAVVWLLVMPGAETETTVAIGPGTLLLEHHF